MLNIDKRPERCTLCKKHYTTVHTEVQPGEVIHVCDRCLEAAKHNFIWICMSCGKVYLRPKKEVIQKTKNIDLKRAYMLCEDMQIIQGIDMCISCDPEGILEYMDSQKKVVEC